LPGKCRTKKKLEKENQGHNTSGTNNFNQSGNFNQDQNSDNFNRNSNFNQGQNSDAFNQNNNFHQGQNFNNFNQSQNSNNYNQNYRQGNSYDNSGFDTDDFARKSKDIFNDVSKNVGNTYQKIKDERQKAQEREQSYTGTATDLIIPNFVTSNDGEIPVKQFNFVNLRNYLLGFIPTGRAIGKLLITNKRVIFSARGHNFSGLTNYHQEFSISEIGGVKFRKSYRVTFKRFIGILLLSILLISLFGSLFMDHSYGSEGAAKAFSLLSTISLVVAGFIVFFPGLNKWIKFIAAVISMSLSANSFDPYSFAYGAMYGESNTFYYIVSVLKVILLIYAIVSCAQMPDIEILVSTKGGGEAVKVKAYQSGLSAFREPQYNCGYSYILPAVDTELAIREVGAIIDDIQVLGDYGVDKWKQI
jgi:hypothetical protein